MSEKYHKIVDIFKSSNVILFQNLCKPLKYGRNDVYTKSEIHQLLAFKGGSVRKVSHIPQMEVAPEIG